MGGWLKREMSAVLLPGSRHAPVLITNERALTIDRRPKSWYKG